MSGEDMGIENKVIGIEVLPQNGRAPQPEVKPGNLLQLEREPVVRFGEWELTYEGYSPQTEREWRARFTQGNQILKVKPTIDGSPPVGYINGCFGKDKDRGPDEESATSALINIPDYFESNFVGAEIDLSTLKRTYNMRNQVLTTSYEIKDTIGKAIQVESTRFLSMSHPHLAFERTKFTPTYSGEISIETGINAAVGNNGIDFYQNARVEDDSDGQGPILFSVDTVNLDTEKKNHEIAIAQNTSVASDGDTQVVKSRKFRANKIVQKFDIGFKEDESFTMDKVVSVHTDVDQKKLAGANINPIDESTEEISQGYNFEEMLAQHNEEWDKIWEESDVLIDGDSQMQSILRFNLSHVLSQIRPGYKWAGIGPKDGNDPFVGYGGRHFWDGDLFDRSVMTAAQRQTMLEYRHMLLTAARKKAKDLGFKGVLYPWEAPFPTTNPNENGEGGPAQIKNEHGQIVPIEALEQEIHINSAVAFAVMEEYWMSKNEDFLREKGSEIILKSARFYRDRAVKNEDLDRFEFHKVTGPDEYHPDVNNDAYTNIMAKWTVLQALKLIDEGKVNEGVWRRTEMDDDEIRDLRAFAEKIYIPFDPKSGVFKKYDEWDKEKLVPIDFNSPDPDAMFSGIKAVDAELRKRLREQVDTGKRYPELDGLDANDPIPTRRTDVIKQHDVLLALINLGSEILDVIPSDDLAALRSSGKTDNDIMEFIYKANYEEYYEHVCDGSSLSPSKGVEASLNAGMSAESVYKKLLVAAGIDLVGDTHGTGDGIHEAAAGGAVQAVINGFAGIKATRDALVINPNLPSHWKRFSTIIDYGGKPFKVEIDQIEKSVTVHLLDTTGVADKPPVRVQGEDVYFEEGENSILLALKEKIQL